MKGILGSSNTCTREEDRKHSFTGHDVIHESNIKLSMEGSFLVLLTCSQPGWAGACAVLPRDARAVELISFSHMESFTISCH